MVEIRARVRGFLEEVKFESGAEVKKDEPLYLIQEQEYKATVDAATAEVSAQKVGLEKAGIELARQEKLFTDNATAETNVVAAKAERDGAIANLAMANAALDRAKLDFSYTKISSPIDGRVGKTLVKQGNLVGDKDATHLTTVVMYDPIYASFTISERDLLAIMGDREADGKGRRDIRDVKLYLARATDKGYPFHGNGEYADIAVDQSTGTFLVRGIFPNPDQAILPGLFVRIRVPLGKNENAILIPERAIGADQTGRYVYIVNSDDTTERRDIDVGAKYDNMVVVTEGLNGDERVIIDGVQRARPGAKVSPKETKLSPIKEVLETVRTGVQAATPDNSEPDPATETSDAPAPPASDSKTPETPAVNPDKSENTD